MEKVMKSGPLEPDKNPLFSKPESIPEVYWERLTQDSYDVTFLGFQGKVLTKLKKIEIPDLPIAESFQLYLVILSYLSAKKINLGNDWVLAKELKGGIHFFDRSHPLTVRSVLNKVDSKDSLMKAFSNLKGFQIDYGDFSYQIEVFPEIHLRYIFFEGDDEFDSELTVNFQKGIEEMLSLDVIWAMVNVINKVLLALLKN